MTAIADGLAGFAVAQPPDTEALPWLLASTACIYAGGVTLNDFFDRELDAHERPERPIPSGRVRPAAAAFLGGLLLVAGILAATQSSSTSAYIAIALSVFVLLYDAWAKQHSFLGPVNMAICRGLNLLLGISAVPAAVTGNWYLSLFAFLYICGITALSRGEVHGAKRPVAIFSLTAVLTVLAGLLVVVLGPQRQFWWAVLLVAVFAWRVLPPLFEALQRPEAGPIRNAVRTGVLSLVLLDAVIGSAFGGILYGAVILATGLVALRLAKVFAVT